MKTVPFQLRGYKDAFLLKDEHGGCVGTISRFGRGCPWETWFGLGAESRHVGNFTKKQTAISAIELLSLAIKGEENG